MLCERCKIREANIQYTEVVNGVKAVHHFCAQCAQEMDFGPYSAIFDGDFPLGKLLSGLLGIESTNPVPDKLSQVVCPVCGTSYEEFINDSRFGCADCYSIFGPLMGDSLKQLQGSDTHCGKKPKFQTISYLPGSGDAAVNQGGSEGASYSREIEEQLLDWDARLKEALRIEDYETAADCRDRIRELKKGQETNA